MRLQVLIIAEK